jgi:hypothetical protein
MVNKHFFKILIIFTGMIVVGLIAVFVVSYFDKSGEQGKVLNSGIPVAN